MAALGALRSIEGKPVMPKSVAVGSGNAGDSLVLRQSRSEPDTTTVRHSTPRSERFGTLNE